MATVNPFGTPMTAQQYADEWEKNSEAFSQSGAYVMLANEANVAGVVIEVGCGAGDGTFELTKHVDKVVVLEANTHLAEKTRRKLQSSNVEAKVFAKGAGTAQVITQSTAKVLILLEDVLTPKLDDQLAGLNADSLICWFIGAAPQLMTASLGITLANADPQSAVDYRLKVHRRCYLLGLSLLKQSGLVHMVDRGRLKDDSSAEYDRVLSSFKQSQQQLGPQYKFADDDVVLLPYHGKFNTSSIQYTMLSNTSPSGNFIFMSAKGRR